jgi:hypothetical protein
MNARSHIRGLGLALAVIITGVVLIACPTMHPAQGGQSGDNYPHMRRALNELRKSKLELREGGHDFGRRREEAIQAVDSAIRQLDGCLKLLD